MRMLKRTNSGVVVKMFMRWCPKKYDSSEKTATPTAIFTPSLVPFSAVHAASADVLASVGSHGAPEGEVRHHGEAVDPHYDHVCGNHHLAKTVGKGLHGDHGQEKMAWVMPEGNPAE